MALSWGQLVYIATSLINILPSQGRNKEFVESPTRNPQLME